MRIYMRKKNIGYIIIFSAIFFTFSGCSLISPDISITDAKIVTGVDENLMPLKITDTFPAGTSKVSCWIQWKNAKINTQLLTKWHYVTDDIPVLDYTFTVPKKDGNGSVALSMPDDKPLPRGEYRVELILNKRVLRSVTFRVE